MTQRLKWERGDPELRNDYRAFDPETGQIVGSIHENSGGGSAVWLWYGLGEIGNHSLTARGHEDTKQGAADALTAAWFEFKARFGGNRYRQAKGS